MCRDAEGFYPEMIVQTLRCIMQGLTEMLIELRPSVTGTHRSELELFGCTFKC